MSTPNRNVPLIEVREIVVVGAVGMWESRSDFHGTGGRVENLLCLS